MVLRCSDSKELESGWSPLGFGLVGWCLGDRGRSTWSETRWSEDLIKKQLTFVQWLYWSVFFGTMFSKRNHRELYTWPIPEQRATARCSTVSNEQRLIARSCILEQMPACSRMLLVCYHNGLVQRGRLRQPFMASQALSVTLGSPSLFRNIYLVRYNRVFLKSIRYLVFLIFRFLNV